MPGAQRGQSSSTPEMVAHWRGPPEPGEGFSMVSDMLVKLIESQDAGTIMKRSKIESCIKEMVLHMGTPSVLLPIVDFLAQLEGAKQYCLSDKRSPSFDFAKAVGKPYMNLEHCSDPDFFETAGITSLPVFADVLDELMSSIQAPERDPTFRYLWDVQITLSTILMCF